MTEQYHQTDVIILKIQALECRENLAKELLLCGYSVKYKTVKSKAYSRTSEYWLIAEKQDELKL